MTFKKDYINYLLYTVVHSPSGEFKENYRLSKLVDSIIAVDDVMKVTFIIGKTAGLDILFKYLLYISDKIDKSQVTIFNLKDNFEYDKQNIAKICSKIDLYKSENVQEAIKEITSDTSGTVNNEDEELQTENKEKIVFNIDDESNISGMEESEEMETVESENDEEDGLTLIENSGSNNTETEVFELESISESVENSDKENENNIKIFESFNAENGADQEVLVEEEGNISTEEFEDTESIIADIETENNDIEKAALKEEDLPEIEIEVHKPKGGSPEDEHIKEEAITNEAYYTFESRFFEEVKILEKLLASVGRDCITDDNGKLSDKCLQALTEILGITSELSNLSRQLSFDLTADIFLTMNIYFTRSISQPELLTFERISLLDSSLALVNSLIKGEDYLNYDSIVDKIEKLKSDISGDQQKELKPKEEIIEDISAAESIAEQSDSPVPEYKEIYSEEKLQDESLKPIPVLEKPELKKSQLESANFKLKYLVKEFEKSFTGISNLKGEYSKIDALEKIGELNNALRLIAKISAAIKNRDVLKLAEVTYVFLKYVKDYRMDMQEAEVQQIIKYIIFTFKMLLTERKPEDFNVLVQHLNNPVKIFADS